MRNFKLREISMLEESCIKILEDKELYVTVEDKAFCISSNGNKLPMVLCNSISSEQEEAETKVFLCAQFSFDIGFERVNIVTVDTDVAILGMYFQSMLNGKIYLQYGTSSATTLYDLSENSSDRSLIQALPGLHAFSGCDYQCQVWKKALDYYPHPTFLILLNMDGQILMDLWLFNGDI